MIEISNSFNFFAAVVSLVTLTLTCLVFYPQKKTALYAGMPYTPFRLIEKVNITHNTRRFKFALQTPKTVLGLPIGNHFKLRFFEENGNEVIRSYTPVTSDDEVGYVELVVKIYPDGKMGQYLDHLHIGDPIDIMGPRGFIFYDKPSQITHKKPRAKGTFRFKTLNMIAGGTGLTPMYQVIQQVIKDVNDKTVIKMIYGNITDDDILCRQELENMRQVTNVDIVFTLDNPPDGWKEETGYVTSGMISKHLAPPSEQPVTLVCGPPPMMRAVVATLKKMEYATERILSF